MIKTIDLQKIFFSKAYIRKWQMKGNENTAELHLLLYHEDTSKPKKDA